MNKPTRGRKRKGTPERVYRFLQDRTALGEPPELKNWDLRKLNLRLTGFPSIRFRDCDLRGATIRGSLDAPVFFNCDLSGARFLDANLPSGSFAQCDLTAVQFNSSPMPNVLFNSCSLDGADLSWCAMPSALISRCSLHRTILEYAVLESSSMTECELFQVRLEGARLGGASFYDTKGIRMLHVNDPRGYRPVVVRHHNSWQVVSGCHQSSITSAIIHWGSPSYYPRELGDLYVRAIREFDQQLKASKGGLK